jgi:hypothetical protein
MSDYLTQVVTRSLGLAAIVRPRPKSLFEPEQPDIQPAFEPEPGFAAATDEARHAAHDPPPTERQTLDGVRPRGEQSRPVPGLDDASLLSPDSPDRGSGAEPPPDAFSAGSQVVHISPRRSQARSPQSPAGLPTLTDEPRLRSAPLPQGGASEPVVPPEPLSSAAEVRPTLTAQNGPRGDAGSARPALAPGTGHSPIEPRNAQEPPRSLIVPAPVPAPPEAEPWPSSALGGSLIQPAHRPTSPIVVSPQAVPAEQTIHVTIGRIEVRAAPPPTTPARPKSAPAPTMSLEDYLRSRSGGQR